jgi:surface carbohydrate biosynthesis protein
VLLGVDHKWRDLPTYACLHRLLETKYGMDVTVIRRTWEKSYLSWVRPDIVVFEALFYPWVQELARELHELGVKIVILPTEGAPIDQPNKLQLAGKGVDYSVVDLFVSWNEGIRDRIVESGALTPEKVEVAGCPRFDFYRLPLDRLVMGRDEFSRKYRLPPNRATITFASGFVLAGMATRNREFLKQDWQALQKNQTGVGWYDDPYAMAHAELKTRELFLEALQKLHAERPDWNFILRPHPGEDQVVYSEFAKKKFSDGRVRVVPSEYIWNVLRSTDVLVARASTTAVEAWLAGKPSVEFQLNPVDFSKNYVSEYEPGSIPARSYEELRGAIDRCLAPRIRIPPAARPARRSSRSTSTGWTGFARSGLPDGFEPSRMKSRPIRRGNGRWRAGIRARSSGWQCVL